MADFKAADWGADVDNLLNRQGNPIFKRLVLKWSKPQVIDKGSSPFFEDSRPLLYAIVRNHHSSYQKDRICYIGLSTNPAKRFQNHPTARQLIEKRGTTALSYAYLDTEKSSNTIHTIKRTLSTFSFGLYGTISKTRRNSTLCREWVRRREIRIISSTTAIASWGKCLRKSSIRGH